jgi:hypothetical protein
MPNKHGRNTGNFLRRKTEITLLSKIQHTDYEPAYLINWLK